MLRVLLSALVLAALVPAAGAVEPVRPDYVDPGGAPRAGEGGGTTTILPPARRGPMRSGDCHGFVREHYLPEAGRAVRHRHVGPACRPVLADPDDLEPAWSSDCHRDVREHWLPGAGGKVPHRHVGEDCRVRVIRRSSGG